MDLTKVCRPHSLRRCADTDAFACVGLFLILAFVAFLPSFQEPIGMKHSSKITAICALPSLESRLPSVEWGLRTARSEASKMLLSRELIR